MIGTVGNPVLVDTNIKFAIKNVALFKLSNNDLVDGKYFYYLLKSSYVIRQLERYKRGGTQSFVSLKNLRELKVPVPSLEKQEEIANILDKAQELIDKRKYQVESLDELVKSRFIEIFGDPVLNSKGWQKLLCRDITLKIGSGATPKGGNSSYKEEGISLIRSMNVHNNKFIDKDLAFIDDEQAEKLKNVTIEENDVLLNITGASVARCCIVPNEYIPARVNQHVAIIRCKNEKILPNFLSYQLTNISYQRLLWDIATSGGATREAITKQQIEKLELIIPPIEIQKEFTAFIHQVDKLKFKMESSLKELENNFNSLMQKAFNGEL
ncbi:restriction endonuclease subunit S [Paeniclostridium sp. NSJ-45]|uniref:Restriction endonuclease subunit S n=2 Tax=Paeniclostridium hominis TaxID=2764329 RepID=A0ABR7K0Q1_9FIRM|nr:restriction endonuclease subunit S [Paeniclostridium hominis]